jgi:hypothetical protein
VTIRADQLWRIVPRRVIRMVAATGYLTPVASAITPDILDVLNALRATLPPEVIRDL